MKAITPKEAIEINKRNGMEWENEDGHKTFYATDDEETGVWDFESKSKRDAFVKKVNGSNEEDHNMKTRYLKGYEIKEVQRCITNMETAQIITGGEAEFLKHKICVVETFEKMSPLELAIIYEGIDGETDEGAAIEYLISEELKRRREEH